MTDDSQPEYSEHQRMVLDGFTDKRQIYAERAAIYKDNYKVVGRVMKALFPDGAPALIDPEDYDRWHIFELIIVKLTRYTNNWADPHKDSLDDLQVYGAILGALDAEYRERAADDPEDVSWTSEEDNPAPAQAWHPVFPEVGTMPMLADPHQPLSVPRRDRRTP